MIVKQISAKKEKKTEYRVSHLVSKPFISLFLYRKMHNLTSQTCPQVRATDSHPHKTCAGLILVFIQSVSETSFLEVEHFLEQESIYIVFKRDAIVFMLSSHSDWL